MHQADLAGVPDAVHQLERAEEGTRTWPVGQVVKTEASHAFNIGSNPVRVTTFLKARHAESVVTGREVVNIYIVGADWCEGPPVPIPNTEVKLTCAEDTCRVTDRENR